MQTITSITPAQLTPGAVFHTCGRDAAFDGGGGVLFYDQGSTAQADGGIVYTVAGAPGRLLRQGFTVFGHAGEVHAAWYGVGRNPAASDVALQAIKASPHIGNAEVRLPTKVVINQPFVNDRDGLKFRGLGHTAYLLQYPDEQLLSTSGTVVEAGPAFPLNGTVWTDTAKTAVGSAPRCGGGLSGVTINGRKRAGTCHAVLSVSGGIFEDVFALDPIDLGLSFGIVVATDGSRIGSASRCRFTNYIAQGGRVGCALWGNVPQTSNACLSTFMHCTMRGSEAGWEFGDCDSNWFYGCGGGVGILHAGDTCPRSVGDKSRSARANVFVAWQAGMTAKANVLPDSPPSYRNILIGFSRENSADLLIEPGAKLIAMVDQTKRLGDCAGHMMGLEPSGFLANLKVNKQIIPNAAWTPCIWGVEAYEQPPYTHASLVPEIVVPGGVVTARVSASLVFEATQAKGRLSARLLVNGAELATPVFDDEKAAGCGPLLLNSPVLKVKAGDVITIEVQQTTGANMLLEASSWVGVEWL